MTLPSPSTILGVPGFPDWYPGQERAFLSIMDWYHSPTRFLGLSQPTGGGKSCIAILAAAMSGTRTCLLTATKGLQDQLASDFGSIAVVVKGQNNFTCTLVPTLHADEGPCHEGMSCVYSRTSGCPYREQLQKAIAAPIVITNYAYHLAQTNFSTGLGEFGLLVADEGHMAFGALENFLTIHLYKMDVEAQGITFPSLPVTEAVQIRRKKQEAAGDVPGDPDLWSIWRSWAECSRPVVAAQVEVLDTAIKSLRSENEPVPGSLSRTYRVAKSVSAKIDNMAAAAGDWVIQRTGHGYVFTPRWISSYGDSLFGDVPKVMIMSAILSHKTADCVGVPSTTSGDRHWLEVRSYFPSANTPIWHIPTARINYRTDDYGATLWQSRIDQIIQRRLDRKGIVFTVSYERARMLLSRSRFKDIMLTHSTSDVTWVVNRFKSMKAPAVLVSPSVTTGYDFPGLDYIVVGKIPYPDTKDPVMQARHEDDNDWSSYMAMDVLVQECGRGTRSDKDKCEVLVVDDNIVWFMGRYAKFAPLWFRERYRGSLPSVPDPLV